VNAKIHQELANRKSRIERRLDKKRLGNTDPPVFTATRSPFIVNGGQEGRHLAASCAPGRHDLMAEMAHVAAKVRQWRVAAGGAWRG
jgi:hypothetical protein